MQVAESLIRAALVWMEDHFHSRSTLFSVLREFSLSLKKNALASQLPIFRMVAMPCMHVDQENKILCWWFQHLHCVHMSFFKCETIFTPSFKSSHQSLSHNVVQIYGGQLCQSIHRGMVCQNNIESLSTIQRLTE